MESEENKDKILLAGPWVGEFGWELFGWQAYLRYLSQFYKETHVISRPGHGVLYEDFATKFYEFDPQGNHTSLHMCNNMKASPNELIKSINADVYFTGQFNIGVKYDGHTVQDPYNLFEKQIFHKYTALVDTEKIDILMHPRNKPQDTHRNWSNEKWEECIAALSPQYSIAIIGNSDVPKFDNTIDLRNIPLSMLVSYMANTRLVVGPSSGPMHLASLCGAPHLVWTSGINRMRYEQWWNPFGTKCILVASEDMGQFSGWDPPVESIVNSIDEFLKQQNDASHQSQNDVSISA
jgi:hypothetical protein